MIALLNPFKEINENSLKFVKNYTPKYLKNKYNTIYNEAVKQKELFDGKIQNIKNSITNFNFIKNQRNNINSTKEYLKFSYIIIKKIKNTNLNEINYDYLIKILFDSINENNDHKIELNENLIKNFKEFIKNEQANDHYNDKKIYEKIYLLFLKFKNLLNLKLNLSIIENLNKFLEENKSNNKHEKDLIETFFLYAYCINLVFGENFESNQINLDNFGKKVINKPIKFVKKNYKNLKNNVKKNVNNIQISVIKDKYNVVKETYVNNSITNFKQKYNEVKENYVDHSLNTLLEKYNEVKENYVDTSITTIVEKYNDVKETYVDTSITTLLTKYNDVKETYVDNSLTTIVEKYNDVKETYVDTSITNLLTKYNDVKETYVDTSIITIVEKYNNVKENYIDNNVSSLKEKIIEIKENERIIFIKEKYEEIKENYVIDCCTKIEKKLNFIKKNYYETSKTKIENNYYYVKQNYSNIKINNKIINNGKDNINKLYTYVKDKSNNVISNLNESKNEVMIKYEKFREVFDDIYYQNSINLKIFYRHNLEYIKNVFKENKNLNTYIYHSIRFSFKRFFKNHAFYFQKYIDNSEIEIYYVYGTFKVKRRINGLLIVIVHQKFIDYLLKKFHNMMTELHLN